MRTRMTLEIFPNKVMAFSEKSPGREDGETTKLSDGAFLIFGSTVSIKEQGRQQQNAEVWKGGQDIEFFALHVQILPTRQIAQNIIQGHGERGGTWAFGQSDSELLCLLSERRKSP